MQSSLNNLPHRFVHILLPLITLYTSQLTRRICIFLWLPIYILRASFQQAIQLVLMFYSLPTPPFLPSLSASILLFQVPQQWFVELLLSLKWVRKLIYESDSFSREIGWYVHFLTPFLVAMSWSKLRIVGQVGLLNMHKISHGFYPSWINLQWLCDNRIHQLRWFFGNKIRISFGFDLWNGVRILWLNLRDKFKIRFGRGTLSRMGRLGSWIGNGRLSQKEIFIFDS